MRKALLHFHFAAAPSICEEIELHDPAQPDDAGSRGGEKRNEQGGVTTGRIFDFVRALRRDAHVPQRTKNAAGYLRQKDAPQRLFAENQEKRANVKTKQQ